MRRLLIALLLVVLASCKGDRCDTPFGKGDTFDINQFAELNNVGGAVILNRGYKGILVRRVNYSDFVAFECACPKDHEVALEIDGDWGAALLVCPVCGSRFETEYGNPLEGAATPCPLYEYRTSFDGNILSIY